jgi:hypothetical protein
LEVSCIIATALPTDEGKGLRTLPWDIAETPLCRLVELYDENRSEAR